jgi:hypothetical protein
MASSTMASSWGSGEAGLVAFLAREAGAAYGTSTSANASVATTCQRNLELFLIRRISRLYTRATRFLKKLK